MVKRKIEQGLSLVFDFFVLQLLWVVSSLGILTIGAATTALYSVLFKRISEPDSGLGTLHLYWNSFRENFKQATFLWAIYCFFAVDIGLVVHYVYKTRGWESMQADQPLLLVLLILMVLYCFTLIYIFPLLAHFQLSTIQCFVNALGISFKYIGSTVLFITILGLIFAACWFGTPILVIALPLSAWLLAGRMLTLFRRQIPQEDNSLQQQEECM